MSMRTKRQAQDAGRKVLRLLIKAGYTGWKLDVWENLGWHWRLLYELPLAPRQSSNAAWRWTASVRESVYGRGFYCMIGQNGSGCSLWTEADGESHKTPGEAFEAALARAQVMLDYYSWPIKQLKRVSRDRCSK